MDSQKSILEYIVDFRSNPENIQKSKARREDNFWTLTKEEKEFIFYETRKRIDIPKLEKMFEKGKPVKREFKRLCTIDGPSPIFESLRPDAMKIEIFKDMGQSFCMRCHRKRRRTHNLALCSNCVRCKTLEHCPAGDIFWHGHTVTDHLSDEEYNNIWNNEINRRKQGLERFSVRKIKH